MIVTTKVEMDLQSKGITPRVDAVQGDTNTRTLELLLYEQGKVWEVPADVTARIRYRKPDGTGGVYDTLPDGARAWHIAGNTLTFILTPQMLAAAGKVQAQAELLSGTDSLATFEIQIDVARNVAAGVIRSEDYVNMRGWLQETLNKSLELSMRDGVFTPDISVGSVTTLSPGSVAAAHFTGTGKAPVLNLGIPEGYTPQKGVDYWTEADLADMQEAVENALRPTILAQLQKSPGFADSTEECTDTEKMYVLPDGYLYAYMEIPESGFTGTNLVPTLEALDSTAIYNGTGYKDGYYISSSSGNDSVKAGHVTTGMIAYEVKSSTMPPVIYLKGGTPDRIGYYYADKSFKVVDTALQSPRYVVEALDTGYYRLTPVMNTSGNSAIYDTYLNIGYLRFDVICESGADLIIALDEEIVESQGKVYRWANTGRAFVPTDYEERIVALEEDTAGQEARISTLESGSDGVPDYVRQEAERVADLILDKRNARCLCFVALSDIHYPYDDTSDDTSTEQALLHAAMGITGIRKYVPLDFIGLFGDYVRGGSNSTIAENKKAMKMIRKAMYEAGLGVQQIWLQGNHDRNPYDTDDGDLTEDELYSYIFAGNAGTVVDSENVQRGYGYQDFETQKLRVIYLNSSDISGAESISDHMWSAAQLRWLADVALDFSGKAHPTQWGVVVLSHQPMNWGEVPAFTIIEGYASGAMGAAVATEGERVAFDFTKVLGAEVICCINGHTHNFRCAQIGENGIWQIAVPQICAGRYNEYGISWPDVGGELDENGNPVYHYKKADSAEDTSFCILLIDRKNRKIHALHYGAGIDREMKY